MRKITITNFRIADGGSNFEVSEGQAHRRT